MDFVKVESSDTKKPVELWARELIEAAHFLAMLKTRHLNID